MGGFLARTVYGKVIARTVYQRVIARIIQWWDMAKTVN